MIRDLVTDRDGRGASAVFSRCRTYRYTLTRTWEPARPVVVWLMLNPSTADASTDDPTIRRCVRFATAWGAGGIVVHNLFALRTADPWPLHSHRDPVGPDNDAVIAATLADRFSVASVVAAWGNHGGLYGRDRAVRLLVAGARRRLDCLGWTGRGCPRHPLRLAATSALVPYPEEASR